MHELLPRNPHLASIMDVSQVITGGRGRPLTPRPPMEGPGKNLQLMLEAAGMEEQLLLEEEEEDRGMEEELAAMGERGLLRGMEGVRLAMGERGLRMEESPTVILLQLEEEEGEQVTPLRGFIRGVVEPPRIIVRDLRGGVGVLRRREVLK